MLAADAVNTGLSEVNLICPAEAPAVNNTPVRALAPVYPAALTTLVSSDTFDKVLVDAFEVLLYRAEYSTSVAKLREEAMYFFASL